MQWPPIIVVGQLLKPFKLLFEWCLLLVVGRCAASGPSLHWGMSVNNLHFGRFLLLHLRTFGRLMATENLHLDILTSIWLWMWLWWDCGNPVRATLMEQIHRPDYGLQMRNFTFQINDLKDSRLCSLKSRTCNHNINWWPPILLMAIFITWQRTLDHTQMSMFWTNQCPMVGHWKMLCNLLRGQ